MSEPDPEDVPGMEASPPEQTVQTTEKRPQEPLVPLLNEPDIPKRSTFAEGLPKPEDSVPGETDGGIPPPFPEREPTSVEKPRASVVENPNPDLPQAQTQPRLNELEQPPIGQTATPALPSVYKGPDAIGLQLSALGVELVAVRTALKGRLARSLSGFNFPGKVGNKG